jgi:anaerobic ribonucleoside-triphosphate reductase activating protein
MRYAGLILNDIAAAPGLSVTFFSQGCPHRCPGCHNPETWDYEGGKEFTPAVLESIKKGINAQGIQRNLCIMGGEPMCDDNVFQTLLIIKEVKEHSPATVVYVWTGYTYEQLQHNPNPHVAAVLNYTDVLIDGPYIQEQRDITLAMRGSSNQRIIDLRVDRK